MRATLQSSDLQHLLIVAAMEEEERALVHELGEDRFQWFEASKSLNLGALKCQLGSRTVTLARSGMGTVNAALAVAAIAERQPVDAVLLLGVGGALSPELCIGDLVVSDQVLQHDYYSSLDFGNPRMKSGEIVLSAQAAREHVAHFVAHPDLVRWVATAGEPGRAHVGAVLSGNEFVGTVERKRAIAELHGQALLVEMEAAGVAQVASRIGIPFVVAKTVADRLQPDGSIESDFRACLQAASANAARVLRQLLERG